MELNEYILHGPFWAFDDVSRTIAFHHHKACPESWELGHERSDACIWAGEFLANEWDMAVAFLNCFGVSVGDILEGSASFCIAQED